VIVRFLVFVCFVFVCFGICPASGQWLNYPTAKVPRSADGKPNLAAPAPRTGDGRPDFSGIWEPVKNRPCPPDGCPDQQVSNEFVNIGWYLNGGLPYQPWAAAAVKTRVAENGKDDPGTRCLPTGIVKLHTTPFYRRVIQSPDLLAILYERNATYRQIYTDGRPLPEDMNPTWNGYSTGKWEGDTLVVQSAGFRDGTWLDRDGSPLTEAAKITERFRRVNYGRMEIEITVDDTKAYTKPWMVKLSHNIVLDSDMLDYICLENEKDIAHLIGK
jgi:hypothetical protein